MKKPIFYKPFAALVFILSTFASTLLAQSTTVAVTSSATSTNNTSITTRFVVPLNGTPDQIFQNLQDQNLITNKSSFQNAYFNSTGTTTIAAGAYKLSTNLSQNEVINILKNKPYMVWVVIPPGLRKEEVANILTKNLNWDTKQKKNFLAYTNQTYNYLEGVYFPDTYLIPVNEDPKTTFNRFVSKFNEKFSPLQKQFAQQNFPWLKALTLASIVQREAANKEDMSLIAGILLNRIDQKVHLGVDATLQYIRGDKNANIKNATTTAYWAPISVADKKINSKYNTYRYYGLPPHPIASPSLEAIKAVLNPASTSCVYYLHDKNGNNHCSVTYQEHLQNIQTYLKN